MTPTPPLVPSTVPGFVVLDLDLPDRPPLAKAGDYEAGLHTLAAVQEQFYDQRNANGEGGARARARADPRAHRRHRHHRPNPSPSRPQQSSGSSATTSKPRPRPPATSAAGR